MIILLKQKKTVIIAALTSFVTDELKFKRNPYDPCREQEFRRQIVYYHMAHRRPADITCEPVCSHIHHVRTQ